jgi:hypothetical protein
MTRFAPLRAVLMVTALVVVGCSTGASSPTGNRSPSPAASTGVPTVGPTTEPSPAPIDVTPLIPAGAYAAEVPAGVEAAPGRWVMELKSSGILWTNPENGSTFSPGTVTEITKDTIVFGPDPGCPDQGGSPTPGTYKWAVEAGQLRFTFVSDSCAGRRDTLSTAPWTPST